MSLLNVILVVLKMPKSHESRLAYADAVHKHLANHPQIQVSTALLAQLSDSINTYKETQTSAASKVPGAREERRAALLKLKRVLGHIRDDVQGVAESQNTLPDAEAVAKSVLMALRKFTPRKVPPLSARNTATPGTVVVTASSVASEAVYLWQYSVDQKEWTDVPLSLRATCTISGLKREVRHYFRFRAVTRTAEIDFSDVVSLLVQ